MIKKLRIHNFKTFLNFEIDLTRRHLLIGKNNSGKSNLGYALRFLASTAFLEYDKITIPGGLEGLCHRGYTSRVIEFECDCELPYEGELLSYEYRLSVEVTNTGAIFMPEQPAIRTKKETLCVTSPSHLAMPLLDDNEQLHPSEPLLRNPQDMRGIVQGCSSLSRSPDNDLGPQAKTTLFKRFLGNLGYYSLSAPLIRYGWSGLTPGSSAVLDEQLGWHGHNLSTIVFQLKNQDEPRYRRLLKFVSMIEPDIDSINFYVTPDNKPVPYVILKNGQPRVSWDSLSDGTLYILALATISIQAERLSELKGWAPPTMIIEEPENGLYRGLLRELWDELEVLAPRPQFLMTSQSPYCIDLFDHDLHSITRLKKEGGITNAKSLYEYRNMIEQYQDDFTIGELHFKEVFGD